MEENLQQQHLDDLQEKFTVTVNDKVYNVEPICDDDHCTRFKISTDCEYLFTLCMNDYGNWEMEKDITPLDEKLIDEIGRAIEYHDA
jgi:hypothetical protein